MEKYQEAKDRVRGMCAKFEREIRPLIEKKYYEIAAGELEQIIMLLIPFQKDIFFIPSGINYCMSLNLILKNLKENKKPSDLIMKEYAAYAAQVQMPRND